ncbi:g11286 [Coccomyxa elongata]
MRLLILSGLAVISVVATQVLVHGEDATEKLEAWNKEYTMEHVPPDRRAYLYRAYRDALEDRLVVFGELSEEMADTVTECVFHTFDDTSFSLPATVTRLPFSHIERTRELGHRSLALEEYVPIRVDCPLQQKQFRYAAASLKAGEDRLVGMTEVIDISTERVGLVAACVGPLVTGSLPAAWLDYHDKLGIDHFFSFVPSGKEYTDGKYNMEGYIPHTILDYLHWFGQFRPQAINLEPHPSLHYLLYAPPATGYYFGQFAMMHACWYEQRYAYDFIMDLDTDEYIWLNSTLAGQPAPLHAVLRSLPADVATVQIERYTYPLKCQPSELADTAPLVQRALVRTSTTDNSPKMILRPKDVVVATPHEPYVAQRGMKIRVAIDMNSRQAPRKHSDR